LQNGLPDFSNYFEGIAGFELWMRQTQPEGKDARELLISFDTPASLETFVRQAALVPAGDGWKSKEGQAEQWTAGRVGELKILVGIK